MALVEVVVVGRWGSRGAGRSVGGDIVLEDIILDEEHLPLLSVYQIQCII